MLAQQLNSLSAQFLSQKKGSEELALAEIRKLVEDWVLSMEPRELANLAAKATTPNKYAFSMACRHHPKWELSGYRQRTKIWLRPPLANACTNAMCVFSQIMLKMGGVMRCACMVVET